MRFDESYGVIELCLVGIWIGSFLSQIICFQSLGIFLGEPVLNTYIDIINKGGSSNTGDFSFRLCRSVSHILQTKKKKE